jgi:hypothetical protein
MPRPALLLVLAACGNGVGPPNQTDTASESSGHSETGAPTTTHPPPIAGTTADDPPTTPSSGSEGSSFVAVPTDLGDGSCDPFLQDCPRGEKCTWYANDGGTVWNATKCEPIMEDPAQLNEDCFVVDNAVTGIDNCDLGLICWFADVENLGRCIALCSGSAESPTCTDGFWCRIYSSGAFCYEFCHPLSPSCTHTEDKCLFDSYNFSCAPYPSGDKQVHEPCDHDYSCAQGLSCINSTATMECDPAFQFCCEPLCDTSLPNNCPGQDQECLPFFEPGDAPSSLETLGVCSLP